MLPGYALFTLVSLLCMLLSCRCAAQSPAQQDENRSFYAGMPVTHPEQLSGIWEAPADEGARKTEWKKIPGDSGIAPER